MKTESQTVGAVYLHTKMLPVEYQKWAPNSGQPGTQEPKNISNKPWSAGPKVPKPFDHDQSTTKSRRVHVTESDGADNEAPKGSSQNAAPEILLAANGKDASERKRCLYSIPE